MAISSPGARPGATLLSICYSFCGLYLPGFSSANVERAGLGQGLLRSARNDCNPDLLRTYGKHVFTTRNTPCFILDSAIRNPSGAQARTGQRPKSKIGTPHLSQRCVIIQVKLGLWALLWCSFLVKNRANSLRNRTI